ncbi:MAG: DUF1003 domain-containing protein [Chlorobi bacterium]|nr:DUF1003 domain-containing protein [Chlorobiota bacterium]
MKAAATEPSHETHAGSCQVCGTTQRSRLRRAFTVRPAISELIRKETGVWDENGWICLDDLQQFQYRYIQQILETEKGEITRLDHDVLKAMQEQEVLSKNPDIDFDAELTFGQRLADKIASFGGSWSFIMIFGLFLFLWMGLNSWLLVARPFDPYPFILLNLVLSSLAAIQAPLIMMSQNRQEARDRARAIHDYQVNLKAELEIRQLHQKVDHLLSRQWERLVEIQEIQMELINDIRNRKEHV